MSNGDLIFVVEDEPKIARLLCDYLERDGFATCVVEEGTHAVDRILRERPALVVLDLMLPGKDGLSICKEVRASSEVPIIMVTARVDEIDRLLGLELGADDYVCKPFSPREVVARVRTILRRVGAVANSAGSSQPSYRDVAMDPERFRCLVGGADVELTRVEFRILQALIARPGRVLSRDQLMKASYDDYRVVSDRTIDSHIKNLRRKLAIHGSEEDLIHSVYGVGYKLE